MREALALNPNHPNFLNNIGTCFYKLHKYSIAKKYKLRVIEDAAHAFGSYYVSKNKKTMVGSNEHSDISTFSFHPVKSIATGEGGCVTTNSKIIYEDDALN